jgi:AAA domain-containing protein
LSEGNNIKEVKSLLPNVVDIFHKYVQLLKENKVPIDELAFTKRLSKDSNNYQQAIVMPDLCLEFLRHGIQPSNISVMAAYRPHVGTINSLLEGTGVGCTTVHKMLGAENDVVILATTRSNTFRDLGFMNQPELLNVATSRHLMKLIIVGDASDTFASGCKTSGRIYDFIASCGICICGQ